MTDTTETDAEGGPVRFMQQLVSLDYAVRVSPVNRRFGSQLHEGHLVGHRCPSCSLVYLPPKGYCPICTVATGEEHEVEVADRGTVTGWTVLTPIQYHGQKERADYALASILLDGADGTIGQQRLLEIPLDEIRMGLRVEAVWAAEADRGTGDDRGWGFGTAITGWQATGEPDVDPAELQAHTL
jgi:uncharacterized OB-fold protein